MEKFAVIEAGKVANIIDAVDANFTLPGMTLERIQPGTTVGIGWTRAAPGIYNAPLVAQDQSAPLPVSKKLTKRAFQSRFPTTSDGVSTKYDLMTLFLQDDGYAGSLGVTGANLYALRALIVTGKNRLDSSSHVDLGVPDAANFTGLLLQTTIPTAFRLTTSQRNAILNTPVADGERWTGGV